MPHHANNNFEFITIVGNSFEEVAAQCRAEQLSEREFSIVSPIGRHRISVAGPEKAVLDGSNLVSATYARRAPL